MDAKIKGDIEKTFGKIIYDALVKMINENRLEEIWKIPVGKEEFIKIFNDAIVKSMLESAENSGGGGFLKSYV